MVASKEKVFNTICKRIEKGESINEICKDNQLVTRATFYNWLSEDSKTKDKQLIDKYARAKEIEADLMFDEIIEIADNSGKDKIDIGNGVMGVNHEAIQRDRLRVDARKWALSKKNPKKYGDKLEVETTIKTKLLELPPDFDPTKEPE